MKHYKVSRVTPFANHVVLDVEPASPGDAIQFIPGQYATVAIKRKGYWSPTRCLSLTNTPNSEGHLQFGFRVTGHFTADLAAAKPGDELRIQGAFGDFQLHPNVANVVCIAGGIGITPFMSMARHAAASKSVQNLTLLYSCQKAEDIPFEAELRQLAKQNPRFKTYFFLNTVPEKKADYLQGPITPEHLERLTAGEPDAFMYYICGPEGMMKAMRGHIEGLGVHPEDILTESFAMGNKERGWLGLTPTQMVYTLGALSIIGLAGLIGAKDVKHVLALSQPTIPVTSQMQTQPTATRSDDSNESEDSGSTVTTTPVTTPTVTTPTTTTTPTYTNTYTMPRSQVS